MGDDRLALHGHRWRMIDTLELGELAAEAASDAFMRQAQARSRTSELAHVPLLRATPLLFAGDGRAAERASREALALGERMSDETNMLQAHVLQLILLRRERGGLEALADTVTACASRFEAMPGWRCVRAYLHVMVGRRDEARGALEDVTAGDFCALPVDGLSARRRRRCSRRSRRRSARPRRRSSSMNGLLPYAERNVPLGWVSACTGSASRQLGLLAGVLGRPDAAATHFDAAIAMNERMGARGWMARTHFEYARHLLSQASGGVAARASRAARRRIERRRPRHAGAAVADRVRPAPAAPRERAAAR